MVERTVSRWRDGRWETEGATLADYRGAHAYVLLGEGGSGKTTAFRSECRDVAHNQRVPARHFIRRDLGRHPEWWGKTLFIDGLDEQRAGGGDPREPLDELLSRIERLGGPRFRLSCREESWLGGSDLRELFSVTNGEEVHLLRLDPLSRDATREILVSAGVKEPDDFLWNAGERGLDSFLWNPLLLHLLTASVQPGSEVSEPWPDTQLATFDRACRELVRDLNKEHGDAWDGVPFSIEEVVMAAGRLCAIALLSDKLGWSRRGPGTADHPPLSDAGGGQDLLKFALDTKLFAGSDETGRSWHHRRIAEFLAAKYLDERIRAGLPATRVLALMAGGDGIVAPDLRGVSAWLATVNREARVPLIEMDPNGVAFGGDAGHLERREIERLLSRLESQLDYRWIMPSWASLNSLLAGPAKDVLWAQLLDPDRSRGRQQLVGLLLRGLTPLAGSDSDWTRSPRAAAAEARGPLLAVVRDDTWRDWVRHLAVRALIHVLRAEPDGPHVLLGLLRELSDGRVRRDDRDELRGELLAHLYPGHIGPEEVWNHMPSSMVPSGKDASFWKRDLVESSSPEQVKMLLQVLMERAEELLFTLAQHDLEVLPLRVLGRALELFGEEADATELYKWFELVEADRERAGLRPARCDRFVLRSRHSGEEKRIYGWLRAHPETQLGLVLEGLKRDASFPPTRTLEHRIGLKFLGDEAPPGFRRWCLDNAVALAGTMPGASVELTIWAVTGRDEWGPPLPDNEVMAAVACIPWLRKWHEERLAAQERHADEEAQRRQSPPHSTVQEQRARYVATVRDHLTTLQAGEGPLEMLHELGRVYVSGLEAGGPDQARADLTLLLDSDQRTVDAVLRSFRRLVGRNDLPTIDDILQLREQRMMSWYALPFLAGLVEDERDGVDILEKLDEAGLRRALAFYFLARLPTTRHTLPGNFSPSEDCRPTWYRHALELRPHAVADVMAAVHRIRVRDKQPPDQHLYDMAAKDEYARVAPLAAPKMFTPFPSRCAGEDQLASLRQVLLAAIRHMPRRDLIQLISRRLARRGMDVAQRGYWLAAGCFVAPEECLPRLVDFLSGDGETRVLHVVDFLVPDTTPLPNQDWPTAHLAELVRAVGARLHSPWDDLSDSTDHFMGGDDFASGIKAELLVKTWVKTLAHRLDDDSAAALADLADDTSLSRWYGKLRRARDEQAERRRAATRKAPTEAEVREALRDGPPSSAADLAALVADRLHLLAKRIRDGSTDAWISYWHRDPNDPKGRKVTTPSPEDACRKVLVFGLRPLLEPRDVVLTQDEQVAEEKRPDIVAHRHPHAVPIEIKKTDSKDLWTAAAEQLRTRYCRDPRSDGYGIYLVLWFGDDHLKKASPHGRRPESPGELQRQLEAQLAPHDGLKIRVIVIDVSAPPGRRAGTAR